MVSPINSLQNMEYMLYGGASGANGACPSYANGYMANRTAFNGYYQNGVNPNYYQAARDNTYVNTPKYDSFVPSNQGSAGTFGASPADLDTLGKYYLESLNPSESLLGAAVGGAAFEILNNFRFVSNPYNSFSTLWKNDKTFAEVRKKGSKLYELWRNPDTHKIMTDAYGRMHKLEGAAKPRIGMVKHRLDEGLYKTLKAEMEAALKSGNKEAIATATEKIRIATSERTGWLFKNRFWGKGGETISAKLADKAAIQTAVTKNIAEKGSKTLTQHLIHDFKGQAGLGGLLFAGMEFVMDWGKINSAFDKDHSTGMKQLGQTSVKAAGSIIGWSAGSAVGSWAGAKLGAVAGTAICPGLGTAIGAVAGAVGGMIGCNLMGRLTHWILGDDVGSKAEVNKMKKTAQGQVQLLQLTAQQAQSDKKLDPKVAQALQNVASVYA